MHKKKNWKEERKSGQIKKEKTQWKTEGERGNTHTQRETGTG